MNNWKNNKELEKLYVQLEPSDYKNKILDLKMSYENTVQKLQKDEVVLLDGGTGTELQKRGLDMVPGAWCGPVSLKNADVLEKVHLDYIEAGADIITANTYASSRIMLREAGYEDQFEEINRVAIETALRARDKKGQKSGVIYSMTL